MSRLEEAGLGAPMTAVSSPAVAPTRPSRVVTTSTVADARTSIAELRGRLKSFARLARDRGEVLRDQSLPVEALSYVPPRSVGPSVVLIGGMGAMAGLDAYRRALDVLGPERRVSLFQLCTIPDRTTAIDADRREPTGRVSRLHQEVVRALAGGLLGLRAFVPFEGRPVWIVFVCATVHLFVEEAMRLAEATDPSLRSQLRVASLVECAVRGLSSGPGDGPVLLLTSAGSRTQGVYACPVRAAGMPVVELDETGQALLTEAIYEGAKVSDDAAIRRAGGALLARVIRTARVGRVLAGCTEIPMILASLRDDPRLATEVQELLVRVSVIDPLEVALDEIRSSACA